MGRIRILSGSEICAILARNGFTLIRQLGSHIVVQRVFEDTTITVPVPNHREVKIGPLLSIIRQSHIAREEFEG